MGRAPFQVLVLPFIRCAEEIRYCVFERRSPAYQHQFIAGGGEDNETPLEAAKREAFEEAKIQNTSFIPLISFCYVPTNTFSVEQRNEWGKEVFVIPEYAFAVELTQDTITLSDEHIAFQWLTYTEAMAKLQWDSNKTALYELDHKINIDII